MSFDFRTLPRCQATAKSTGQRCCQAAMKGKRVCYIHGGKSPGAPKGNKNAARHGLYSKEVAELMKQARMTIKNADDLISQ